jgi:hypothetical protein
MSYREKSAWACLLTTIAVFVPYFAYVFQLYAREDFRIGPILSAFIAAVIVSTLLNVVAHVAMSIVTRREPKDERDLAIESRSFKVAYYILGSACFLAMGYGLSFAVIPVTTPGGHPVATLLLSQVLLLCFVAAEVVRYLIQAVGYRRGS